MQYTSEESRQVFILTHGHTRARRRARGGWLHFYFGHECSFLQNASLGPPHATTTTTSSEASLLQVAG